MTQESIQQIIKDRAEKYGDFRDQAILAVDLKEIIRHGRSFDMMPSYMKESLDMICHKIARIVNGDPKYLDSWVDLVGYAQLARDRLTDDLRNEELLGPHDEPLVKTYKSDNGHTISTTVTW
jgi:hypothetical protein